MELQLVLISLLFAISLAGFGYHLLDAVSSGAEMYSASHSEDVARQLEDVFLFIPPKRINEAGWVLAGVAFILVFVLFCSFTSTLGFALGILFGTVAALLALMAPGRLVKWLKRRRLQRFNTQLVDTLVGMSNSLKAGFSIMQAFEAVVRDGENPIAQEFDMLLQQTRVGVNFSDALANLEARVGSADLTLVINAIETARKTGGNLTEVFEKIASTIRQRVRIENRIQTLTAQGRLQGIIVSAMPAVIGLAMFLVDPQMMKPFIASPVGVGCILVVAALIACGALVIRRIVNIDV